ncbi:MAG: hypothetical protein K0S65_4270, partial [Labilithrix sp.]|nr:hypothetical protein [Labilithrix sp.]
KTGSIIQPATRALAEHIVRRANADPEKGEDVSGIWFERRDGVAIFRADAWLLRNTRMVGDLPAAIVAAEHLQVFGRLEVTCGQLGGGLGGNPATAAPGPGGGKAGASGSGAGGGGHAATGGAGGVSKSVKGGAGGGVVDFTSNLLAGGSGGGGAGARGGSGGGAILLVARTKIELGDGQTPIWFPSDIPSEKVVNEGVDVGGCGGAGGGASGTSGGGGGAGGLVVLESPTITVRLNAGLAANGGGGGGGGSNAGSGARGNIESAQTAGGSAGGLTCGQGKGGTGGGGMVNAGGAGQAGDVGREPSVCINGSVTSAGGGGAGGRIRVFTRSGRLSDSTAGLLSPTPAVTFGMLDPQ